MATNTPNPLKPINDASRRKVFIETYGCQMNVNDSEVVLAILQDAGFALCSSISEADLILVNTCSVRENAEQRVLGRLDVFRQEKKKRKVLVGVLGCMAQRMKEKLLENESVDIVAGPDSYRELPRLVEAAGLESKQMDALLSHEETYGPREDGQQRSLGLHLHNARMQQRMLILHRALRARSRAQPRPLQHPQGGPQPD